MDGQLLETRCPYCGSKVLFIHTMMVSEDFNLILAGECEQCEITITSYVPLTELYKWSMVLKRENERGTPLRPPLKDKAEIKADALWLHELGVKDNELEC